MQVTGRILSGNLLTTLYYNAWILSNDKVFRICYPLSEFATGSAVGTAGRTCMWWASARGTGRAVFFISDSSLSDDPVDKTVSRSSKRHGTFTFISFCWFLFFTDLRFLDLDLTSLKEIRKATTKSVTSQKGWTFPFEGILSTSYGSPVAACLRKSSHWSAKQLNASA